MPTLGYEELGVRLGAAQGTVLFFRMIPCQFCQAFLERRYAIAHLIGVQFILEARFAMWRELRNELAHVGFSYQVVDVAIRTGQSCLPARHDYAWRSCFP